MSKLELEATSLRKVLQNFNEQLGVYINDDQRFKLGRVLTIIDAAISDPEQRKAIKDLVNNEWWSRGDRNMPIDGMSNPHTDLRAICQLFGFELYDSNSTPLVPGAYEDAAEEWAIKKYKKIATEQ
ncbi:MAG: hypothetical protein V4440_04500 [Pseudomonadota bacterium]